MTLGRRGLYIMNLIHAFVDPVFILIFFIFWFGGLHSKKYNVLSNNAGESCHTNSFKNTAYDRLLWYIDSSHDESLIYVTTYFSFSYNEWGFTVCV